MCGFAVIFDLHGRGGADRALAEAMTVPLIHRGPDSADGYGDGTAALGFRRLRIIDLEGGEQPMTNEDGSLVLVCNGEIFNYRQLTEELRGRGHVFKSRSDVEVILHLYEEMGDALVDRLDGQFAFALYDRRRRRLLAARDHFGVCPLFHARVGDTVLLASEVKALLEHPDVERRVDLTGLDQLLDFPGLVSPRTLFAGVSSLPAGHLMRLEDGRVEVREYWDLVYPRMDEAPYLDGAGEAELTEDLGERLRDSVRKRLQADVEVGFYLSGGLDSSLIAALVSDATPGRRRHSFSIGFRQQPMDEAPYQRLMARAVGSRHHPIVFDEDEVLSLLRRSVWHAECPVKETYNTCSMALSRAARDAGVTVVLTGEGADELFAGYVGYRFDEADRGRAGGDPLAAALEAEARERLWGDPDLFYETDHAALREVKAALYHPELAADLESFECLGEAPVRHDRLQGRHPLHQRSYLDFKLRLADHLVADHGDRMALASSVEARYPFLDLGVVDLARRLPPDLKLRGLEEKYLLRRFASDVLPPAILEREKFGFHAPGSPHLLRSGCEWVEDLLSTERIRRQGYFNPGVVERLKARYRRPDFELNQPFETDLLTIILTFGLFLEEFDMPERS